jgi:hypothetical protein
VTYNRSKRLIGTNHHFPVVYKELLPLETKERGSIKPLAVSRLLNDEDDASVDDDEDEKKDFEK